MRKLAALLLVVACRKPTPPAAPVDASGPAPAPVLAEQEPNDDAAHATELTPGKPMQGTFSSAQDQDWYRLALPPAQPGMSLRVEVKPAAAVEIRGMSDGALLATLPSGFARDLSVRLAEHPDTGVPGADVPDSGVPDAGISDAGIPDAGSDDAGVSDAGAEDAGAQDAGPAPSGYYLVVKPRRGAPLAPYTLTASLESGPADLEQEPNDDAQHATPLQSSATGYLSPPGDLDWYRLHADGGSVLYAQVSPGAELAILNANKAIGRGEIVPSLGLPEGDSFVVVRAAADAGASEEPYKLSVTLSPDDGTLDREPNNDLASAQTVTVPATVKGYIWPRKDVDFYRFHIPAGHAPVSFTLSLVRGVDLGLRLYELHGASSEVIGSSDSTRGEGEERLLSVPLKEGDFAVEVFSPRNKDASATDAYTLAIQ